MPFYYTVPDGHNPAGFSFSEARRRTILDIAAEEGLLVVEDAPYVYISYAEPARRRRRSSPWTPAARCICSPARRSACRGREWASSTPRRSWKSKAGRRASLTDLLLTEASADILFQNPRALRSFESLFYDDAMRRRDSLWPVAERKLAVYRENRAILLDGLEAALGGHPAHFRWTNPEAGFFSVYTFLDPHVVTDDAFVARLVSEHGVVTVPLHGFYPPDARRRNPRAGCDQLRLSFCFTERTGGARRAELGAAVDAFARAALAEAGLR